MRRLFCAFLISSGLVYASNDHTIGLSSNVVPVIVLNPKYVSSFSLNNLEIKDFDTCKQYNGIPSEDAGITRCELKSSQKYNSFVVKY